MSEAAAKSRGMGDGILRFNSKPPKVYVTCDDVEFDSTTLAHLKEEGFDVTYLPYTGDLKSYKAQLKRLPDDIELGAYFAIIAFGKAAAICLDVCTKPLPHLCTLVAYYPDSLPPSATKFPPHFELIIHQAATQGIPPAFHSHVYQDVYPGFAEHDLDEFDKVAAGLAWSRTLTGLRKGFKIEVDLEQVWKKHIAYEFVSKNTDALMTTMDEEASVNYVPTITGGIGRRDLHRFYQNYFIPKNPPSFKMKLVSRTIGTDRVVDEMIISFKHTQEVPWILPDVPATNKQINVALVAVVCVRGGKICQENVYWDQASVLVQAGLLDPKLVPDAMKKKGLSRLPVYGTETAAKVLDESSHPSNDLLSSWKTGAARNGSS